MALAKTTRSPYGHPIPENSFAVRDLRHKLPGVGLFDLRRTGSGGHACTFCGACHEASAFED